MKTYKFNVDKNLCDAIQNQQLVVKNLTELYANVLGLKSKYSICDDQLDKLQKQVLDESLKYDLLKAEVEQLFVGVNTQKANWELDYITRVVTVYESE